MAERAGEFDPLAFAVGKRKEGAVEKRLDFEEADGPGPLPREAPAPLPVPGRHLERVCVHHPLVSQEVAHAQGALLFEAVPARLQHRAARFALPRLEGDVANRLLRSQPRRRGEMILQFPLRQRHRPAPRPPAAICPNLAPMIAHCSSR